MRIHEIFFRDLDLSLKLKYLLPEEISRISSKYGQVSKVEYMMIVLNTCVYNLRTEVNTAIQQMGKPNGDQFIKEIYNGCIMLNPALDIETWVRLTQSYDVISDINQPIELTPADDETDDEDAKETPSRPSRRTKTAPKKQPEDKPTPHKITKSKFINLHQHLIENVVGQQEAIDEIYKSLKRSYVGLKDPSRPIGVFLLAGPSGVGKTHMAKTLHSYIYGDKYDLVRIDCGEFQQKHESTKLIGSPNSYVGYEDGGQLTNAIKKNPSTVLLLDEVEKAHPDIWGTFLNVFDDGYLIDNKGNEVSFADVIIIMTSNLGNDKIAEETFSRGTGFHAAIDDSYDSRIIPSRKAVEDRTNEAIRKYFKPELLNRLDQIVIFNYLTEADYSKIAEMEILALAEKMSKLNYNMSWDQEVIDLLVRMSGKTIEGARSISKIRRNFIEDPLADILLQTKHRRGTTFNISSSESGEFVIETS